MKNYELKVEMLIECGLEELDMDIGDDSYEGDIYAILTPRTPREKFYKNHIENFSLSISENEIKKISELKYYGYKTFILPAKCGKLKKGTWCSLQKPLMFVCKLYLNNFKN